MNSPNTFFHPGGSTRTLVESHHYGILIEQLCKRAAKWDMIATGLRFTNDEINNIDASSNSKPLACLRAVLSDWMQWAPGDARGSKDRSTLEALKIALYRANCGDIAETLTLTEKMTS